MEDIENLISFGNLIEFNDSHPLNKFIILFISGEFIPEKSIDFMNFALESYCELK